VLDLEAVLAHLVRPDQQAEAVALEELARDVGSASARGLASSTRVEGRFRPVRERAEASETCRSAHAPEGLAHAPARGLAPREGLRVGPEQVAEDADLRRLVVAVDGADVVERDVLLAKEPAVDHERPLADERGDGQVGEEVLEGR